jgi:hypothetical protein
MFPTAASLKRPFPAHRRGTSTPEGEGRISHRLVGFFSGAWRRESRAPGPGLPIPDARAFHGASATRAG